MFGCSRCLWFLRSLLETPLLHFIPRFDSQPPASSFVMTNFIPFHKVKRLDFNRKKITWSINIWTSTSAVWPLNHAAPPTLTSCILFSILLYFNKEPAILELRACYFEIFFSTFKILKNLNWPPIDIHLYV